MERMKEVEESDGRWGDVAEGRTFADEGADEIMRHRGSRRSPMFFV